MRQSIFTSAALVFLTALPAAAADLTIVSQVTSNGKTSTATDYYTASKVRMTDGDSDTIFDLGSGQLTTLDHARRQYSQITLAEIEAAMQKAAAQMEEAMRGMPPAMREKMEKMMGGGGAAGPVTVAKVAGGRSIAGYDTQRYVITIGPVETESFTTEALQPPVAPAELMRMRGFANPAFKGLAKAKGELEKIKGMPLASKSTITMMGKTMVTTKEATEVKLGPVPASAFDVPAGYKKVDSPLAKMR